MKKILVIIVIVAGLFRAITAPSADFNGDGTDDIAICRPTPGLWAVRGITRAYYGSGGDIPVPGDYNGNGTDSIAICRPTPGLWAVRGVTRVYYGGPGDIPIGSSGGGSSSLWKTGLGGIYTLSDVGIGLSAPLSIFHIEANQSESIILSVGATSRSAQLVFNRGGSNDTFIGPSSSNQFDLVTRENIPIVIGNSLTERMRIDTSGLVGIGTSSPTSALHVKGVSPIGTTIRVESGLATRAGIAYHRTGDTQSRAMVYLNEDNNLGLAVGPGNDLLTEVLTVTNNPSRVGILAGQSPNYTLEVNGSAGKTGGGTWADSCDERLKKEIKPLDGKEALDSLCRLRGVTFEWINPEEHSKGVHAGVVAQNVEEVFPEWVVEIDARGRDRELFPAGDKAKAVSLPHGFNAYIIESIKELRSENDKLEERLVLLEERMK
jgi:Chaperone of endosialidase